MLGLVDEVYRLPLCKMNLDLRNQLQNDEKVRNNSMNKSSYNGAGGRMGRTLTMLIRKRIEGLELFGAVDLWDGEQLGMDAGQANGLSNCGVEITCNLEPIVPDADVVIDFSYHVGSAGNAERIAEWGVVIIGTTGYTEDELIR